LNILPINSGEYILELNLTRLATLQVGQLGKFTFPPGVYLYFGSACGPGGLQARLSRHLLPANTQRLHWHIDYLRAVADVRAAGYLAISCQEQAARRLECLWSQAAASLPGSRVPVPGFGASDCRSSCPAHLLLIHKPEAASRPVLLDPRMQKFFAQAAGLPKFGQGMGWFTIGQSDITSLGSCKTYST
jgi:Uri superfamily endonuclease